MYTIPQTLTQAQVSQYLAQMQLNSDAIYSGTLDKRMAKMIYTERKSVLWAYNANPNDPTLVSTVNYLIWLCGQFRLMAIGIIAGGTGGQPITPTPPPTPTADNFIPITGADFTDATNYENSEIVGKNINVFYNDINRFLVAGEYTPNSLGLQILLPGFDALTVNINTVLKIFVY